jgi:protein-L-isoaspartate(D-aspartate) O-methyltransferase
VQCCEAGRPGEMPPFGPWTCGGSSNSALVANLRAAGLVHSQAVLQAMLGTDRAHYVPAASRFAAYEDAPQPIGWEQTISAPHMHAMALELLEPVLRGPSPRVLDVGSGSGYLCACFQRLTAARGGHVFGIDYIEPLVEASRSNLAADSAAVAAAVHVEAGDGWQGLPASGPFDAIHVGAAATHVPDALVAQLKPGGRMVIPVGPRHGDQVLLQLDKATDGRSCSQKVITGVRYVPLVKLSRADDT